MDRKSLIEALKGNGYTGSETDPAAVKSWLGSQGLQTDTVDAPDGTVLKFDDVWAKAPSMKLKAPTAPTRGNQADPGRTPEITIKGRWLDNARKSYDRMAARGETKFADHTEAEWFAAGVRLAAFGSRGKEYEQKAADTEIWHKTMSGLHNYTGGALIPEEFSPEIMWATETYGTAFKLARVRTMTRETLEIPRKTAIGSMVHRLATGSYDVSDDSYDNVTLNARDIGRLIRLNQNLVDDAAVNVADDLMKSITEARAIRIDSDYFLGDGTSTYGNQRGLISALRSGAYINASGGTWSAVTVSDLINLAGVVENVDWARCCFVSSRQFYWQVVMNKDSATSQFRELAGPGINGSDASFRGWPWYFSQVMPTATAATQKCVYFGDFMGGSTIGLRKSIDVAMSDSYYFNTGDLAMRASTRSVVNINSDGRTGTYGNIVGLVTT